MLTEFSVELRKLGETYGKAKDLVLWAEEIDPESRANIQISKEMRDAFDHLMRVVIRLNAPTAERAEDLDYCRVQIDKTIGHVYRAMFDALDGAALSLRERIHANLTRYTSDTISSVLPDYWRMKEEILALEGSLAALRGQKDIGKQFESVADRYLADLESLKQWDERIVRVGPLLDQRKGEEANKAAEAQTSQRIFGLWIPILTAILGAALGAWLAR